MSSLIETESDADADARVAPEIYPLALTQARSQALFQSALMIMFLTMIAVSGFPRRLAYSTSMLAIGAVTTI